MPDETTFHDLIQHVRRGDESAAAELVRRYEPAIRRAARVHLLDPRLRRLFDSLDISQSVFASFFVRAALGQYDLEKPEQLLGLLVTMSRRKLADHARKQRAARRDYRRARSGSLETKQLVAADVDPGQQAATKELVREFQSQLSEEERQLADLRVSGQSWDQIAAERGENPAALRKRLARAVDGYPVAFEIEGQTSQGGGETTLPVKTLSEELLETIPRVIALLVDLPKVEGDRRGCSKPLVVIVLVYAGVRAWYQHPSSSRRASGPSVER